MPPPDDLPGASDSMRGYAGTSTADRSSNRRGHGAPGRPGRPPGPSTKPALIVVGLTVVLFLIGIGLELASGSQSRPTPSPTRIATARGAVLRAVPARPLLKAIVSASEPPDDLLDALAVPAGSTSVPSSAVNRGVELYDRSLRFEVSATQQDVISFFRAELPALHWARLSQGPTGSAGTQYLILEQHPASDGHEWDLGVTVAPTFFGAQAPASTSAGAAAPSSTAPGPAAQGSGTTSFTLRLFSVSDQD